tara:strand:+ start:1156 stop:2346 length:1191 start_codon:yes stop_codon:yes gene_type:complete
LAFRKLNKCLVCGSRNLKKVLDLNKQPLANSYLKKKNLNQKHYELIVNCCTNCTHLQLSIAVDPKIIYKNYDYVSGTTNTYKKYMKEFYIFCLKNTKITKLKNILDIGCNDGSQLDVFKKRNFNTLGIDPAKNIFKISSKKHKIICDFFNYKTVKKIKNKFDIIIAQNSFAHNPDPQNFLNNIKKIMHKNSTLFIQTSQAEMCQNNEFDTIYHEHINFFNVKSMKKLAENCGLKLHYVEKKQIHGVSYIFIIKLFSNQKKIKKILNNEKFLNYKFYKKWGQKCLKNVNILQRNLTKINTKSKLIGYGAAAKANTFLNFSKVKLDFIVDDNKLKQNKFCPGSKIPIRSIKFLKNIKENVFIIPLAWNFYKEIKKRVLKVRKNKKDKFIIFYPNFKID